MNVSFEALGTTVTLAVVDQASLPPARAALERELARVDRACSRFRADSELARVNAAAGERVHVGGLLFAALREALEAARATDGIVDPTVGRALRLAGYDASFRVVAAREGHRFHASFAPVPGWQIVELDELHETVRVPAGVELDLGATAKALAADRGAAAAAAVARGGVLVAIGGDVATLGEAPDGGWAIGIADDHSAPPHPHSTVSICGGGIATSSTTVRRWKSGSAELHHLIDPRTGRPALTPWRTVSVAAASCAAANTASTAAMILGHEAPGWLTARRLPARLVAADGEIVRIAGWPAEAEAA